MTPKTTVLVVDDSALDRRLAGALLEKAGELHAVFANDGRHALEVVDRERPAIVVTDLQMPELNGLELVEALCKSHPGLPIVLMTAHGSEETAIVALKAGAASYVPKRRLAEELVSIVRDLLTLRDARRPSDPGAFPSGPDAHGERELAIGNDLGELGAVISDLEAEVQRLGICDTTGAMQIGVALREALANAVLHGNLEVESRLLDLGGSEFHDLADRRRKLSPYAERKVRLRVRVESDAITYVITDEGPGFDTGRLPDPTDLSNLEKPHGRGLMLITTFMDEVAFNDRGNQIRMVKRRG